VVIRSGAIASVTLDLGSAKPGSYDLIAVNPGGRTARLRAAVRVIDIKKPEFVAMSPETLTKGKSSGEFEVRAKNLIPEAQVFLRRGDTLIPTRELSSGGGGSAADGAPRRFQLELSGVAPGAYDLVLANSRTLDTSISGIVEVNPEPIPALTGASLTRAFDTLDCKDIVLEGENLQQGFTVVLKRGAVQRDLVSRYVSPHQMNVNIDFRGNPPGTYQVLVKNQGRVVASLPGGITVTTPRARFLHPATIRVLLGYPYVLVLSQSFANSISLSAIGGELSAVFPPGVKFFPHVPGIRDAGIGVELGYSQFGFPAVSSSTATSTLGLLRPGIDLYYRTPFNFPLNGVVRMGYGLSLSDFERSSSSGTTRQTSLDFYYGLAACAELDLGKRMTVESGAAWYRILYASANLDSLALFVDVGVRVGG